ncbi:MULTISPECIES: anti-sigma factor [unclassified Mesorhizobium]|uniref:anti-sigma factor n=1 Tax=unclassified Mesorhizobium TaxID=325217 RepID=UPI000FD957CA|nr:MULTISPECIES: anti-sigma factor [unclassified Mesorhizobium]TGQ40733.1 anti-sigma factor [Mesorhizobium sp. M00.F.Ca.ET.216.01.1.1]TIS60307.1 MAG: anti-sigma factor [Mesorhizobium sp.]TIS91381.1 MAG: anti-sigma factor [Mesorhizobium sp.]TJW13927.1 MAG: anti-sigma factor [Mesorhizobium sp.]TJW48219.1 MAG: anti-sigma factor [Mesorhizobium sp.]
MSAAEKMSRRDEMETLLPFYLNGSLEGSDLEAVEEWLATDPAALAALGEAEAEFSSTAAANEAIRPPADALSRFARALDAEAGPAPAPAASSWLRQAWNRFTAVPVGVAWAAAAALLALVVVQSFMQPSGKGSDFEIAGQEDDLAKMPFALVKFKPDARMSDIAAFLGQNQLKIAGGPTVDGVFRLAVPAKTAADYEKLLGLIAAQPFADAVIEGRKPVDGG